jgi:putative heme-binding domain-containing protein
LLKTIGSQRTRAELLESLINPMAKIAPGYGLVSITLKDGSNLAGALYKEDKTAVTLRLGDGTQKKVARPEIAMQTPPVSMMPPMLGILTAREIRDVVAYLSSLKKAAAKKEKEEH